MPLQLERRGQPVDTFIQKLHHTIVAAIHVDFTNPDRPRPFHLHRGIGCSNLGAAHPSKTFPHTLEKPGPIVVPLIAIVFADEIGNSLPISAIDCVKEMFCVETHLMLGSPKPEQIQADAYCNGQQAYDCSTKRDRHTARLSQVSARQNWSRFLER